MIAPLRAKDPEFNFEVFYRTFKENYPFFKLHHVDWDGIYKAYRPKVTAKTTDDELLEIFSAVIKSFHDPHVSLQAGDRWIGSTKPDALALHDPTRIRVRKARWTAFSNPSKNSDPS